MKDLKDIVNLTNDELLNLYDKVKEEKQVIEIEIEKRAKFTDNREEKLFLYSVITD